jgi:protein CWC15
MTTAHRPTFDPARGKEAARGEAYHQRLLPAHKTLKFRQAVQGAPDEHAKRDLRAELLKAERAHFAKKDGRSLAQDEDDDVESEQVEIKGAIEGGLKRKLDEANGDGGGGDGDAEPEEEEDYEAKKRRVLEETRDIDADSVSSSESSEESEDDDEDETAELMRELAKIKAERAEAAAKVAADQAAKEQEQREKDIALGNPLLNAEQGRDFGVKRRWDDDVVFKNQARGTEEKGKEKRFVNDLLRSDFHRRFMDKYVR